MLAGYEDPEGKWVSGFFDKGSIFETLAGWAKTVVCGRARLGGIPMGFIAAETRMIQRFLKLFGPNESEQLTDFVH